MGFPDAVFRNENIGVHLRIGRGDKGKIFLNVDNPHELGFGAFENFHDFGFRSAGSSSVVNIGLYFVTVQGMVKILEGDENIMFQVRRYEITGFAAGHVDSAFVIFRFSEDFVFAALYFLNFFLGSQMPQFFDDFVATLLDQSELIVHHRDPCTLCGGD